MIANCFAGETTVFMLQFGNFLSSESGCFAMSRAREDRIWCNGRRTAIERVSETLAAISHLCICVCTRAAACVHVYVCPSSIVLISSKVSRWSLDLDILQVLVRLLALLCILVDVFRSRYTACHSLRKRWDKFEFQLTDKGRFIAIQFRR